MSEVPALPEETPNPKSPSLLKSVGVMAAILLFSKALGFWRDWAILTVYGASLPTDAYFAAVQLPQASIVLLGGLGGPFHTVTISILSRFLSKNAQGKEEPTEQARQLAATFVTATGLVFALLSLACFIWAKPILALLLQQGAHNTRLLEAAAAQLKIMSPIVFLGSLTGILYGGLNLLNVYLWPALSPSVFSLVTLVMLWLLPADDMGLLLAWSTLLGGILQVLIQLPQYRQKGFSLMPTLSQLKTPEMRQLGELLFPAMIGTGIGQLTTFVDMAFTATLPEGGWSAITLSNRLMQLPIGVLQTALLVPLFPRLAKLAAQNQHTELGRQFRLGVGGLWVIIMPVMVALFFDTPALIRLVFEHGSFNADDTAMVSLAVLFQLGSMIPYFARDTLTRVFYAFGDSKTPLLVGCLAIGLKALLNYLLVVKLKGFGIGGITLSITLITLFNMSLLAILSRKHIKTLPFAAMGVSLFKLVLAGGLMAVLLSWQAPQQAILATLNPHIPAALAEAITLLAWAGLGTLVYALTCWLLGVEETRYVLERLQNRLQKQP